MDDKLKEKFFLHKAIELRFEIKEAKELATYKDFGEAYAKFNIASSVLTRRELKALFDDWQWIEVNTMPREEADIARNEGYFAGRAVQFMELTEQEWKMILYAVASRGLAAHKSNDFFEKYGKEFDDTIFDIEYFSRLVFKLLAIKKKYLKKDSNIYIPKDKVREIVEKTALVFSGEKVMSDYEKFTVQEILNQHNLV
jgi:hypothetical protein